MPDLKEVDSLRNDEGLDKQVHKTLEDIVNRIKKGDSPVLTLAQSNCEAMTGVKYGNI